MNILLLSIEFNYCCGLSRHVYSLSRELKKKGHTVILGVPGGTMIDEFVNEGMEYMFVPIRPNKKSFLGILQSIRNINSTVRKRNIDIIHSHHRYAELLSWPISKIRNIPTVMTCHALVGGKKRLSFVSDKIIAVSYAVKEMLEVEFQIDAQKIILIRNVPREMSLPPQQDLDHFRESLGITKHEIVISGIGRLHQEKGFDVLIKAIRILNASNQPIRLLIAGKGEQKKQLSVLIKDNNLPVNILDEIDNIELVYGISSIVVVPSRQESAGLVPLEAALLHKPIIATRVGGLTELIIDHQNGLLVDSENPEQMASAIQTFLNNEDLRIHCANELYQTVKNQYSIETMADSTYNVYSDLKKSK